MVHQLRQIPCHGNGTCDNLLVAALSANVLFAPAMDLDMYKHPSTIANFLV
jgi:phosphopantothenoylcysteine decarboxylase/phosphopantothenate--cysteine ligase